MRSPLSYAVLWTIALIIGFSIPGQNLEDYSAFSPDKIAHFVGFLIFAILWLRVYPSALVRIVVLGALFGFLVEVYQHVMPIGRSFDAIDALADFGGLLVGVLIGRPLVRSKKTRNAQQL